MNKLIPHSSNLCSRNAEKMISIKLNNHCNMHCAFCVDRGGHNAGIIDVEKIATEALAFPAYKTVIITGGEPFLNFDKVLELTRKLRADKKRLVLNTNGSLLTPQKVCQLNGLIDELQISIHHFDESVNARVFGKVISYENIKNSIENKKFMVSINSTFNNTYTQDELPTAVLKMVRLTKYLGADRLRLTELKKVDEAQFVPANAFFDKDDSFTNRSSKDLIEKGCTSYQNIEGVLVSVKRLCQFAKGKNAAAFSCCFIDVNGQKKIEVDTIDTFKVIYSDGTLTNDWIFDKSL